MTQGQSSYNEIQWLLDEIVFFFHRSLYILDNYHVLHYNRVNKQAVYLIFVDIVPIVFMKRDSNLWSL
jgi:hypothetical protein